MKKITLVILTILCCCNLNFAQPNLIYQAPLDNTTTQVRAPNGLSTYAYLRACALVLQSELTNIPNGSTISTFGFTLTTGTNITSVAGNFTVYLQNTSDVTYNKGTTWSNIISGMSNVYANVMTIPLSTGATSISVTLSSPFVYTGGGLYVAYDWVSAGPFASTPATFLAEGAALNPGCASASSGAASPATLGTTAFRPCFLFGIANPYSNDVAVIGVEAPGRIPLSLNAPHTIKTMIRNSSTATLNNIQVNLNVTGANAFSNTQTITTLAPGASSLVSFAPFNPALPGAQTVSVSVAADQNNANNTYTYSQNVNCNIGGLNPAANSYTSNAVGFGTGSGILASSYTVPVAASLIGIRGAISMDAASVNNYVFAALLNSTGGIIATTNTLMISGGMLGTFQTFTFTTPQNLTPGTSYYLGLGQVAPISGIGFYPAGTQSTSYLPLNMYYSTGLTGGTLTQITNNYGYFGMEGVFTNPVTISASSQTISCGSTATLNALSSTNYSWSTGATTSSIVVSPTITTNYSVTATNTMGCLANTTLSVNVIPITLSITASPQFVVCGGSATLNASNATNYSWSTGPSASSIIVSPTVSTSYSVSTTNASGCSASASVIVQVNAITVNATANPSTSCSGDPVQLSASGASSFTWSTGSSTLSGATVTDTPSAFTIYTVTGTDANGCSNVAYVFTNVNPLPSVSINSSTTSLCAGKTVTLNAVGNASVYTWNPGAVNGTTFTDSPLQNTTYTVTATSSLGCVSSKTVQITINTFTPGISSPTTICSGQTVNIAGTGGASASSYTWSNSSSGVSSISVSPGATTGYTLTAIAANGCSGTNETTVTVNATPNVSVVAQRTVMCKGETNTISVQGASTYTWNSGSTNTLVILTPTVPGPVNYTVVGTSSVGCVNTALIKITVNSCNSLQELSGSAIASVFPNPNNGLLTISMEDVSRHTTARVYNALGGLVKTLEIHSERTSLDISEQPQGIYFVYILQNDQTVLVSRIIKQ